MSLFQDPITAWQASKSCDLRSAFAEATADKLPMSIAVSRLRPL